MRAVIIGAGIGGIGASIRLRKQGFEVDVYEANPYPGGKLSEIRQGGFRFDAGPSLFTMPQYVDELFLLHGEAPRTHFNYERLDEICRYFWEDGTRLTAFANTQRFREEVETQLGVDGALLENALSDSREKYELTGRIFLERPLHKWKSWRSKDVAQALAKLHRLDIFKSMDASNRQQAQHPKLVQFFNRFATYNGSNPYQAPGILNIIPHFEHHFGAYFPKGGMVAITDSLVELAQRQGVRFHFGKKATKINIRNGRAQGILVEGRNIAADVVVSNMDIRPTYKKLMPHQKQPRHILGAEPSSSALIFYWGIRRVFPELDLHNIFFSDDYRGEFDAISEGRIIDDPTVYINISGKRQPSDAGIGRENWFTMINVPYDQGQDWPGLIQAVRRNILAKTKRMLGVDIEPLILTESILAPQGIELKTASHAGALYGTASNDRMAAFRRHANFSNRIKGLYFCGGSVHPGGGIPLSLLSAKITSQLISEDYGTSID